jgi:hypothetical protein
MVTKSVPILAKIGFLREGYSNESVKQGFRKLLFYPLNYEA